MTHENSPLNAGGPDGLTGELAKAVAEINAQPLPAGLTQRVVARATIGVSGGSIQMNGLSRRAVAWSSLAAGLALGWFVAGMVVVGAFSRQGAVSGPGVNPAVWVSRVPTPSHLHAAGNGIGEMLPGGRMVFIASQEATTRYLNGRTEALPWFASARNGADRLAEAPADLTEAQVRPWLSEGPAAPPAATLPADAQELVKHFDEQQSQARAEMEAKLAPARKELIAQLRALQDRYTRNAQLDEAVAIRDRIRQLLAETGGNVENPLPDPGNLTTYRDRVGRQLYIQVVGRDGAGDGSGTIWGDLIYTDDSPLAVAVVHTGILKPGQQAVVRVTILPGRERYESSFRNGITSSGYGAFPGSYSVELAPGSKPVDVLPAQLPGNNPRGPEGGVNGG